MGQKRRGRQVKEMMALKKLHVSSCKVFPGGSVVRTYYNAKARRDALV